MTSPIVSKEVLEAEARGRAQGKAQERERCLRIVNDFGRFAVHRPHNLEIIQAIENEKENP